ncbi:protocadherin-15-like isoform X3 [Ptychodera flava]|uniref:protocadherin-15-like isoform X3 n=1 Tax=Ptychodera flava TaxID=63121 RepID=UPI003969C138
MKMPGLQFITTWLIVLYSSVHLVLSQGFNGDCVSQDGAEIFQDIYEDFEVGETIRILNIQGTAGGSNPSISLQLDNSLDAKCTEYISLDEERKALNLTKALERDGPDGMSSLTCVVICTPLSNPLISFSIEYPVTITIGDINDNWPQFVGVPYQVEISELTLVTSTVFDRLEATDADEGRNGSVSYFVVDNPQDPEASQYFINNLPALGVITLNKTLDYETKKEWHVLIEARDRALNNPKINSTILTVFVVDGDDLGPQFLPCVEVNNVCTINTYTTHLPEKQARTEPLEFSPAPVYAVDQDKDVRDPSTITYSFIHGEPPEYTDYFNIDANGGNITLKTPVDRAQYQVFTIVVKAEETSNAARYATANVEIYIDDVNDNKPNFTQSSYSGYVHENAALGTTVVTLATGTTPLQIEAVDPDVDQEGVSPQLDYRFIGADDRFSPKKSGDIVYVVVDGDLDRETNSSYSFSVIAMETTTNETLESDPVAVMVTILDVNDNPPVFAPNSFSTDVNKYRVKIKENRPAGSSIMTLSASDADQGDNAVVDFSISYVSNDDSGLFGIESENNTATLKLVKAELVAREEYTVTVKAEDRGPETNRKSTLAFVTVEVQPLESSRAPQFSENPFIAFVSESVPPQTVVKTITASDGDGDTIYYGIGAGDTNNEFFINVLTGEISIVNELDRETQAEYNLTVTATDLNQTVSAQLLITVLDINDNNPVFNSSWPTTFQVYENAQFAYVGEVQAYDIDEPNTPRSKVEYLLTSDKFAIDSTVGMIYTTVKLDREEQNLYELIVTAQDKASSPRSSTATFTVIVLDRNDHGPVFDPSFYEYTITENVMEKDFLTVEATDNDVVAMLEYEITTGDTNLFSINNQTGSLSLLATLDYELLQTYILTVTATDIHQTNTSLASGVAMVTIHVLDVNDNPPVFTQDVYRGTVKENADLGTTVISSILATDGDLPETLNGQVMYQIEPQNDFFTISDPQSGVIVTKTSLKRASEDEYQLTVKAYDRASVSERLSDTATVVIEITDREILEEKPVFEKSVYSVSTLVEEQPIDTFVITLRANGRPWDLITYRILSGNHNESFRIESVDNLAQIYTNRVLDREEVSSFILTVEAAVYNNTNSTSGRKRRAEEPNIAEVIIELEDINDNPPQFTKSKYVSGVADDASPFTEVLQVMVTDADDIDNSNVNFTMEPFNSTADLSEASFFQIDANTGMIKTTDVFDKSKGSKYQLTVHAKDTPGGFSAKAQVVISVIYNENRVILVADIPPTLIDENANKVVAMLELILNATVVLENVGPRKYGQDLNTVDPSQTDISFYAVDENDDPLTTDEIMRILEMKSEELNELFQSFLPGEIIEVRPPETAITKDYRMQTTEAALIALGCILFLLSCIAIIVICYSWKKVVVDFPGGVSNGDLFMLRNDVTQSYERKREAERQRNARLYLPMYTNITAYDTNNASDISHIRMPEPVPNPVFLDDQAIQVGEPHFLKAYEAQEFTMDFFADASEVGEGEDFTIQVDPENSMVLPYREHRLESITEQSEPSHASSDRLASISGGIVNPAMEDSDDSDDDIKKPPLEEHDDAIEQPHVKSDEAASPSRDTTALEVVTSQQNGKMTPNHNIPIVVITPNGRVHVNPADMHLREPDPSLVSSNHTNHKPKGNIRSFEQREQELPPDELQKIGGKQYILNPSWNKGHTLSAQGVTILDETEQDDLREAIMLKNSGLGLWMLEDVQSTAL